MLVGARGTEELVSITDAEATAILGSEAEPRSVFRVRFDLAARDEVQRRTVEDLGFDPTHPRFWGRLPSDGELFASQVGRVPTPSQTEEGQVALWEDAGMPRFPLAGVADVGRCVPLGMTESEVFDGGPVAPITTEAEQRAANGVASLGYELFVDARLRATSAASLAGEADFMRFVRNEDLDGLHSLLPVDEVTLLAIPDALHVVEPGDPAPAEEPVLESPGLTVEAVDNAPCCLLATVDGVDGATAYALQWGRDAEFASSSSLVVEAEVGSPARFERLIDFTECDCPADGYVRVRALRYDQFGPWSNTRAREVPRSAFEVCGSLGAAQREVDLFVDSTSPGFRLRWVMPSPLGAANGFRVESSEEPTFDSRFTVVLERSGNGASEDFDALPENDSYYRVRAEPDGPWSNTVRVVAEPPDQVEIADLLPVRVGGEQNTGEGEVLAVHRAALRFCAARGDVVALLSLPRHYLADEALEHVAALRPPATRSSLGGAQAAGGQAVGETVPPLTFGERRALSYGALYHPWTVVPATDDLAVDGLLWAPPAGAVAGLAANLSLERGAWWAPANRELIEVLGVGARFGESERLRLADARINLVLDDPRGFLVLDSQTLSHEREWGLLNVRRLMILLRRLALREGDTYVFEPNDEDFQSLVHHRFEQFLSAMYERGAFRGGSPEEAYRVVTDESVNPRQSIDQGRFIIELQVAPSRPLVFLRVRLVQSGPGKLVLEEIT